MKYTGSCHCGKIAFEAEGTLEKVMECNCSMCMRRGGLLWFLPVSSFTLTTSPDDLSTYTFNKHVIQHHFCASCGIAPYGEGAGPNGPMVAVNARCIDGFDPQAVEKNFFDGRKA